MEDKLYLGIDGGGTKTAISAYDASGRLTAETVCGPLNYNFIGIKSALGNLRDGIGALGIDRERIAAVGIGDPSIDDASESAGALEFAREAKSLLGVPVYVRSDAYITLYGLTGGRTPGVLVISGTGAMAIGEDSEGRVSVAGGWGRLTGDEGSGWYIGLEVVRRALLAADGVRPKTMLTDAALRYFGASSPRELISVFYGENEPDIAGFAKEVSVCAENGDETALDVLHSAANYLADYASVLLNKTGAKLLGVYGSILIKDNFVRSEFERLIHGRFDGVEITVPPLDAQTAAAMYAKMKYTEEFGK